MYPQSSDLHHILRRVWSIPTLLLQSARLVDSTKRDFNSLAKEVLLSLSTRSESRTLIIIDSIDKIKSHHSSHVLKWLPARLAPNIKLILSLRPNSIMRKVFMSRDPKCQEVLMDSLSLASSKQLITRHLKNEGVLIAPALLDVLMDKLSICNPLYIREITKYLARHRPVSNNKKAIRSLPDNLLRLHHRSIVELESGQHGRYLIASLCLLHCSRYGLQESELVSILSALTDTGFGDHIDMMEFGLHNSPVPSLEHQLEPSEFVAKRGTKTDTTKMWGDYLTVTPTSRRHSLVSTSSQQPQILIRRTRKVSDSLSDNEQSWSTPKRRSSTSHLQPPVAPPRSTSSASYSASQDGGRSLPHPPQLPPLQISSCVSLLSSEVHDRSEEDRGEGTVQACKDARPKPLVGLQRVAMETSNEWAALPPHVPVSVLQLMGPLVRDTGRPGERRWSLKDPSVSAAVHERYFADPPTQSFPFSFCGSASFFGADKDQTLHCLMSEVCRSTYGDESDTGSIRSSSMCSGISRQELDKAAKGLHIDVNRRYGWWHSRLAGYFSICNNEARRSEELPYHLSCINDGGRLAHCLVHIPLFLRLNTEDNVMDLIYYWHCTGGYCNIGDLYKYSLDAEELNSGTNDESTVVLMQQIAQLLCQMELYDSAQKLLVNAIHVENNKLNRRTESMASLTLSLSEVLHQSLLKSEEKSLESEYHLITTAGQCVQLQRNLSQSDTLAKILLIVGQHLLTYSQLGGSNQLTATNALIQAQEATHEAKNLYVELNDTDHILQASLQLSTVYESNPSKSLEYLQETKELVTEHYGSNSPLMLTVLKQVAHVYELMCDVEMASHYYKQWLQLIEWLYGEQHSMTIEAIEYLQDHRRSLAVDMTDIRPDLEEEIRSSLTVTIVAEISPNNSYSYERQQVSLDP